MNFEHVCVIGLGYVGLPTAAVLASRGVRVTGVDINPKAVEAINDGRTHIVEPDLDILVNGAVVRGQLTAQTSPVEADAFIIAVPTPFDDRRNPDLSYLEAATQSIAPVLRKGNLVVVESTVPIGATEQVCRWLSELRNDLVLPGQGAADAHDVSVAHSPERVLPGKVLVELVRNDRVIGGVGNDCAEKTAMLYRIAVEGEMHLTTARTAELVKLSENAYRDVNIAFANELANVAEPLNIDPWEVIALANHHPRVNILNPGPGVGGHCIAVDPWFIVSSAPDNTALIQAARNVNDSRPGEIAEKVMQCVNAAPTATIACLGLSYKADIDDLRESPSVEILRILAAQMKRNILVVEPHIETLPKNLASVPSIILTSLEDALEKAEILVLLTDHRVFRELPDDVRENKTVIDTRGIWR